jgi:hypothetical protein
MPFAVINSIYFSQSIFELSDAVGQDTNLVMKDFRVGKDKTVSLASGQGSFGADCSATFLYAASAMKYTDASEFEPSKFCTGLCIISTALFRGWRVLDRI